MKKIYIIAVLAILISIVSNIASGIVQTRMDRYAAEISSDQMAVDGSAEYEEYRKAMYIIEYAEIAIETATIAYITSVICYRFYTNTKNRRIKNEKH